MNEAPEITVKTGPWVDIDLSALCANYAMIRALAPHAETAAVVKCDAYGLGLEPVATALAEREKCRTFFVAYPEEGAALREILNNGEARIYVFNGPTEQTVPLFDRANATPVINSLEQAKTWTKARPGAPAAVHIDTGMNRLGAPADEVAAIAALDGLNVELTLSHLACSSDPNSPMNDAQREKFIALTGVFPDARKCLAASGGAMIDARHHFDMVRPGIALYGGSPFDVDDARIKPVAHLRAPVIQIRNAAPGETVGYGATFAARTQTPLATVALGYGDGFPRAGSGRAAAFIAGGRARIAGRVSMDLISLDLSRLRSEVQPGDIATFFGEHVRLFETAAACGTIPYELLTGLGGRVDRRYL